MAIEYFTEGCWSLVTYWQTPRLFCFSQLQQAGSISVGDSYKWNHNIRGYVHWTFLPVLPNHLLKDCIHLYSRWWYHTKNNCKCYCQTWAFLWTGGHADTSCFTSFRLLESASPAVRNTSWLCVLPSGGKLLTLWAKDFCISLRLPGCPDLDGLTPGVGHVLLSFLLSFLFKFHRLQQVCPDPSPSSSPIPILLQGKLPSWDLLQPLSLLQADHTGCV